MEVNFKTFEKQRIALRYLCDNATNEVLYGGGARGGKSYLGCGWIIMRCISFPESKWLIGREELTKLRDTTLLTFFQVLKDWSISGICDFNAQSLTATFPNGSIIFFRELKFIPSDPLFDRLGSYDLTGAFIDESQQIHKQAINVLRGRFSVLSGKGWQTIPKMLFTCNPAKNWIYDVFVKPDKEGRLPDYRKFVRSLATDNPTISQDYIDNLKKSDKVTVERLLYGNFEYDDDPAVLMDYDKILEIFSNEFVESGKPFITADIARLGKDKTRIAYWNGWRCEKMWVLSKSLVTETAKKIREIANEYKVPNLSIICDEDGVGGGVVDILKCRGFVNNATALRDENFSNRRSQCYFKLAEKVNQNLVYIKCDSDLEREEITSELEVIKRKDADKDGKLAVIPREKIIELIGRSPDYASMLMMRSYFEYIKLKEGTFL